MGENFVFFWGGGGGGGADRWDAETEHAWTSRSNLSSFRLVAPSSTA